MVPLIRVVGRSGAGKTALITRLINEINGRGYTVATIKHAPRGFSLDKQGKDSWRLAEAGAQIVVISSPRRLAVLKKPKRELSQTEIVDSFLMDVDLVLTEGYREGREPMIVVVKDPEELSSLPKGNLLAVVSKKEIGVGVPYYRFNEVKSLADLVEKKFLKTREDGAVLRDR
ncbi:MAG: molybdopterin-guanine dinucleotide biosynthesis protein B [Candidatus Bathyarchaeia archaeon]